MHRRRLSILTRTRPEGNGRRKGSVDGRPGGEWPYGGPTGRPWGEGSKESSQTRPEGSTPTPTFTTTRQRARPPPARKQQASFILISRSRTGSLSSILANGPRRLRRDPASSSPSLLLPSLPTRTVARLSCVVVVLLLSSLFDVTVVVDWMTGSPPPRRASRSPATERPSRPAMRTC